MPATAALGLRIKSGWARAVVLERAGSSPRLVERTTVELSDPAIPEARQPYHAATGIARQQSEALDRLLDSVHAHARRSISDFLTRVTAAGRRLRGAGLVVGSDTDPARIGNQHVRAHALEGRLFRTTAETALRSHDLACVVFVERELIAGGAARLGCSEASLKQVLTALGQGVEGSWRSEDKMATLAAWLVLSAVP